MEVDKPKPPAQGDSDRVIQLRVRASAALVGLAGLVAGGVAVFVTKVEAGPVALIGAGAIFMFIAMRNEWPDRVKFGDNEAQWRAVRDYVEATVDDAAPAERPERLSQLADLSLVAPRATTSAMSAVFYEQMVLEGIRQIINDVRPQIETRSEVAPILGPDMIVTGPTGKQIFVEVKYRERMPRLEFERLSAGFEAQKLSHDAPDAELLVITPGGMTATVAGYLSQRRDISVLNVSGPEDFDTLRDVLFQKLGPIER